MTVCAVFQLLVVKVRVLGDKLFSVLSKPVKLTVTLAVGAVVSFKVKLAVVPVSLVVSVLPVKIKS